MNIQQTIAMKFSDVDFGEPFFISVFGQMQIGLKVSFDSERKLPEIVLFTNEGHPDLKVPAVLDANSYADESVLSVGRAELRRSNDRAMIRFGAPSHRNCGALILQEDQKLVLRCSDGERSSRDVDTSTWMVMQHGIARSRFWFSSASIAVPSDAGQFRDVVVITAYGDE